MKRLLIALMITLAPIYAFAEGETPREATCDGVLDKSIGGLIEEGEFCKLDKKTIADVAHICGAKNCEITGTVIDCPINCVKMTKVVSIRLSEQPTPKTFCGSLFMLFGEFFDAAMVCNWKADGPAITKITSLIKADCQKNSNYQSDKYSKQGVAEFHHEVAEKGHSKSCHDMREFMDAILE